MKWFSRNSLITVFAAVTLCSALPSARAQAGDGDNAINTAKNLARVNCGTQIGWISPDEHRLIDVSNDTQSSAAEGLILDDQTLNCRLPRGNSTFIITLGKISLLGRFSFINEQAAARGDVEVSVSNYRLAGNDPRWETTNQRASFSGKRFMQISLLGVEAKYVKVSFRVEKEGTIAGFGLYGQKTLESFAEQHRRPKGNEVTAAYLNTRDGLNFNFANVYAKARVVYVSSGDTEAVHRMIDDDPATAFSFSPSDLQPTVVVELAEDQKLRRISAVYEMEAGQLDIYLLNRLPGGRPDLTNAKPVVSVADPTGAGKAAAEFDPHGARYVALRWTPNDSSSRHKAFKIAEIGAFGDFSFGMVDLEQFPERLAENSGVPNVPVEPPPVTPVSP